MNYSEAHKYDQSISLEVYISINQTVIQKHKQVQKQTYEDIQIMKIKQAKWCATKAGLVFETSSSSVSSSCSFLLLVPSFPS